LAACQTGKLPSPASTMVGMHPLLDGLSVKQEH